ncbi:hypothetical protein [Pseudomonas sp. 5P_3.1_Bac2]|uniref:hypothetical protein n=1 Tax=Pseudomonas sp. 5P_3.1_Bac2 TaxID=2971617 RepID=UPI0021C724F7|nr:hypothetical protein [Pseudomonas sp. 5P_3.1_Bac2]MCU1716482.1 hypothetical protein [Pseudomonas sp. 5P_3.1_Bac2]
MTDARAVSQYGALDALASGLEQPLHDSVGVIDMSQEAVSGQRHYLEVLPMLHESLQPELYMEIGVRNAGSLKLATGCAVGIDPLKQFTQSLPAPAF